MLTPAEVEVRKQTIEFDVRLVELLLPPDHPKSPKNPVLRELVVKNVSRCLNPPLCDFIASGGINVSRAVYQGQVVRTRRRFALSQQVRKFLHTFVIDTLAAHGQAISFTDKPRIRKAGRAVRVVVEEVISRSNVVRLFVD